MLTFSFLAGLGATLGVWQVARSAPPRQVSRWVDAALLSLLLALLGARAAHVLLEWAYYAPRPLEAFQIWLGGFAWPGAALGWLAGVLLAARMWRMPLGVTADALAHLLMPAAVGVWLGCWQSGCAYGAALPAGDWRGIPSPDESGFSALRFPLQPLMALGLVLFEWLVTSYIRPAKGSGLRAAFSILGLSLIIFIAALAKAQPTRMASGLPLDAWFALAFGAVGLLCAAWSQVRRIISERKIDPDGN